MRDARITDMLTYIIAYKNYVIVIMPQWTAILW